jgi:hypothetical protein
MISYINVIVLKQQQISTQIEDLINSEDIGVKTNVVMVYVLEVPSCSWY